MRINKYLAEYARVSRREADRLIESGKVTVNGQVATLGLSIDTEKDRVFLRGKPVVSSEEKVYYAFYKPRRVVATSSDPQNRKKVTDFFPDSPRVYTVGRLDYESEGLIIVTNDGDLTQRLTHPKYQKEKEYEVIVEGSPEAIGNIEKRFLQGISLREGVAKADHIKMLKIKGGRATFQITLHQGWNRQIRRMCERIGLSVMRLTRIRIANVRLGGLSEGEYRELTKKELQLL